MENLIEKTKQIICENNYSKEIFDEVIELVECLTKISYMMYSDKVNDAFDNFFNYKTLNYVSDEKIKTIEFKKWNKKTILDWLQNNEICSFESGVYNDNALVVAMNEEYHTHKNFIERTGDEIMTTYLLAVGCLNKENYIDNIFE